MKIERERVRETFVYSPPNHLTLLKAGENFIAFI